jgi:hypothetical protein
MIECANILWDAMAGHAATAAPAQRMLAHILSTPSRAASRLGRTAWNAYSYNIDYRTGVGIRPALCSAWTAPALRGAERRRLPHAWHLLDVVALRHRSLACSIALRGDPNLAAAVFCHGLCHGRRRILTVHTNIPLKICPWTPPVQGRTRMVRTRLAHTRRSSSLRQGSPLQAASTCCPSMPQRST